MDLCTGCAEHDIDVTDSLFNKVAPGADGRARGIQWGGDVTGG